MENDLQYQQQIQENTQQTVDDIVLDNPSYDMAMKASSPSQGQNESFDKAVAQSGNFYTQDFKGNQMQNPNMPLQIVFDQLKDVPQQVVGGFWDAAKNMSALAFETAMLGIAPIEKMAGASSEDIKAASKQASPKNLPDVPKSDKIVPSLVRPISQFLLPFAAARMAFVPTASKVSEILNTGLASGAASALGFDGMEGRAADIAKMLKIDTGFTNWLADKENDGIFEARLKNAIDGFGAGVLADSVFTGFKWFKDFYKSKTVFKEATQQAKDSLVRGQQAIEQVGKLTDVAPDKAGNLGPVPMTSPKDIKKGIQETLKKPENMEGLTGNPFLSKDVAEASYRKTAEWQDLQQQLVDSHLDSLSKEEILSGEALQQIKDSGVSSKLFKASQLQADFIMGEAMPSIQFNMKRLAAGDSTAMDDIGETVCQVFDFHNAVQNMFRPGSQAMQVRSNQKTVVGQAVNIANNLREALKNADRMTNEKMTMTLAQLVLDGGENIGKFADTLKVKMAMGKRIEKVLQEVYVNGLLSNPLATGTRDVVSTFFYNGLMVPGSKLWAGVLSPIRQALWKNASKGMDQVYAKEAALYLQSYFNTALNGVRWMSKVLRQNVLRESDFATKVGWGTARDIIEAEKKAQVNAIAGGKSIEEAVQSGLDAAAKVKPRSAGKLTELLDGFSSLRDKSQTRFDASRGVRAISADSFGVERETTMGRTIDFVGNAISAPSGGMMGKDDVVKTFAYNAEIETRAYRKAMLEGLEGEAFQKRVDQIKQVGFADIDWENSTMAKSTLLKMGVQLQKDSDFTALKSIVDRSIAQARVDTFTNQLGPKGEAVAKFIQNIPYGWTVVPFQKTPGNILHQTFVYSPVAPLLKDVRQTVAAGGAEADMALGRIAMGSSIMATGWMLAYNGLLTGKAPKNQVESRMMQSVGYMPNAFKIGDTYFSVAGWEPYSTLLTTPASILQIARDAYTPFSEKDQAAAQDAITMSILGVSELLMDKTYTMNLVNFLTMVAEQNKKSATRFAGTTLASFVPFSAGVRGIMQSQQKYIQQIDSIMDYLRASYTPSGSRPLPDPFGEPMEKHSSLFGMEPYSLISNSRSAAVMIEALRVGASLERPERIQKGIVLTPDEYQKFMEYIKDQQPLDQYENLFKSVPYQAAKETYTSMSVGQELRAQMVADNPDLPISLVDGEAKLTKAGRIQVQQAAIWENARNRLVKENPDAKKRMELFQLEQANTPRISPTAKDFLNSIRKVPTFAP